MPQCVSSNAPPPTTWGDESGTRAESPDEETAASKRAPRKGARGGKYTIDRVIGRGSFGTAWLVRSNADSRMYVMKRLALDHMNEKEKDEAHNECVVLMKLRRHPNIIRVREHFVEDGRLCIVMDFADGGDLAQRIEAQAAGRTPFPEAQVLDWFVQLCLALKHAHDRKVLHRDLKPQNIFLTKRNFVRLGDFGSARRRPSADPRHQRPASRPAVSPALIHASPRASLEGSFRHHVRRVHLRRHAAVPRAGALRGEGQPSCTP